MTHQDPTQSPPAKKKVNTYAELGRAALELKLILYPHSKGGYMLLDREHDEKPVLEQGTAANVAFFLEGMKYQKGRDE